MEINSRACCALPLGSNLNHCARCHQTFSSLKLFDRHQDIDYDRPNPVCCVSPSELGLVKDHKGTWSTPQAASSRLAKSVALASRRSTAAA